MEKKLCFCVSLLMVFSMCTVTGCEKKDKISNTNKQMVENLKLPKEKGNSIDLDIYFKSKKDVNDPGIGKEERMIDKEQFLGRIIMQELISGPSIKSELLPVLPKETRLINFSIKDDVAYVNLSKEAMTKMTKAQELSCLNCILDSLTQLPDIKKVQIQIENVNVNTLGGNYDISKPLEKNNVDAQILKK